MLAPCVFLVGLDAFVTVPLVPAIAADTGIPPDLGALLVTAYALAYAISAPLFGAISDRAGRKNVICLGALVLGVGTVLTGLGGTLTGLLLLRAVTGVGAGMLQPGVFAYVGDKVPYAARGRAMGTILASMSSATVLGVPVGAYLAGLGSWRWPFWAIGLLALLILLAVALLLPKDAPGSEATGDPVASMLGRFRSALSAPSIPFALLASFLWFGSLQGTFANVGLFYARGFGLGTAQIGLILAAAGLGTVAGGALGGRLADRWGKRAVTAG
ncbi:MAG: MFS transporter, partial [Actinomycetota bacterium]|nr:MFS transporter [Actinomycetota bacterium]